jgi:UDP-4-keto-D-QuiNAc 4-reductase
MDMPGSSIRETSAASRTLVTGANGFVGSALCRRLHARGAVRTPTSIMTADSAVVGAIDRSTDWREALRGIEVVVHAAARVHVTRERSADPLQAFRETNVEGTMTLAREALKAGVRRFVFISSIKVNGESTTRGNPFHSGLSPHPSDPYGLSKWEAEQQLWRLTEKTGLDVVVVRPALVYGKGVGGNFGRLIDWVDRGLPMPLGCVENRRSMIGLGNLIDLVDCCVRQPEAAHQTFCAADGEDYSTPQWISKIAEAMRRPARLMKVPLWPFRTLAALTGQAANFERLCGSLEVSIDDARRILNWTPPFSVDEGLSHVFSPTET